MLILLKNMHSKRTTCSKITRYTFHTTKFSERFMTILTIMCVLRGVRGTECRLHIGIQTSDLVIFKNCVHHFVSQWVTHDIIVISDDPFPTNFTERMIVAIIDSITNIGPVMHITTDYLLAVEEFGIEWINDMQVATSRTLLLYIITDYRPRKINETVHNIYSVKEKKSYPKLMFILITQQSLKTIRNLLAIMSMQNDHVAFLESSAIEILQHDPGAENFTATVHQYNYFNNIYVHEPLTMKSFNIFPDKLKDTHGADFRIDVRSQDYPRSSYEVKGHDIIMHGITAEVVQVLREKMNVTIRPMRVLNGPRELVLQLINLVHSNYFFMIGITPMVTQDQECLIIPRKLIPKKENSIWEIVAVISIGFLLLIMISIIIVIFKVRHYKGDSPSTIDVITRASESQLSIYFIGKVLYMSFIVASTGYIALFYNTVFSRGIEQDRELSINSFQELDESGMFVYLSDALYDYVIDDDDISPNLRRRIIPYAYGTIMSNNFNDIMKHQNVTIFTDNTFATLVSRLYLREDKKTTTKVTKFCLFTFSQTFVQIPYSAYSRRVDEIILRLQEAGLCKYWIDQHARIIESNINHVHVYVENKKDDLISLIMYISKSLLLCYIIPFIFLIGEIVIKCIERKDLPRKIVATVIQLFGRRNRNFSNIDDSVLA